MTDVFLIPLAATQQQFRVVLGAVEYSMVLSYADVDEGGWWLSVFTNDDVPLVKGIPLVVGCDLLQPYGYLAIGETGSVLFVYTDGDATAPPEYTNLGSESNLYYGAP